MMKTRYPATETEPGIESRSVTVIGIISRTVGRVTILDVDPGFSWTTAHFAIRFLFWRAPGEPDGARGHARANLSLPHQRLVARRKRIEHVRMLGDPVFQSFTTC